MSVGSITEATSNRNFSPLYDEIRILQNFCVRTIPVGEPTPLIGPPIHASVPRSDARQVRTARI